MHQVKLAKMFSNIHMMLLLMTFLAKPIFKVNKPFFISKQTMDVMWQNIPGLIKEYFTMSRNIMYVVGKIFCHVIQYSMMR
jgi:hypothetical protein